MPGTMSLSIGLEADAKPGARGFGEVLRGPGRGLNAAAFEAVITGGVAPTALTGCVLCHPGPAAPRTCGYRALRPPRAMRGAHGTVTTIV
jgi:hypothetical protein